MRRMLATAAGCAMLLTGAAHAADRGFYFGAIGGRADYKFELPMAVGFVDLAVPDPNFGSGGLRDVVWPPPSYVNIAFDGVPVAILPADEDNDTAWGALVGYRPLKHLAVELSYMDLGELQGSFTTVRPGLFGGGTQRYANAFATSGPAVSVLGIVPLAAGFELFARLGVLFADTESTVQIDVDAQIGSDFSTRTSTTYGWQSVLYGGGAQYHWGDHWTVRLDYQRVNELGERFRPFEADIDIYSLNVLFRL